MYFLNLAVLIAFLTFCGVSSWALAPSFWIPLSSKARQVYLILTVKFSTGLAPLHFFVKKVWKYVCEPKTLWGLAQFAVPTSAATALECCFAVFCRHWQQWGDGSFNQQGHCIMVGDFSTQITKDPKYPLQLNVLKFIFISRHGR